MSNENKLPDERAESDMREAFAQHMGQPWEAALDAARRIWSLAWGASRFYARQAQPDERAACEVCENNKCVADDSGHPCPFVVSLASIDAHDPQSFINGAKWAFARATAPQATVKGDPAGSYRDATGELVLPLNRAAVPQAGATLTDEQIVDAVKSVCRLDEPGFADAFVQYRAETIAMGRAIERALLASVPTEQRVSDAERDVIAERAGDDA